MFKKLVAVLVGGLMAAMSLAGGVLAADYTLADFPAPFVEDGTPNFLIVVGSGGTAEGIASDLAGLINVAARLGGETVTTTGGETGTTVTGEAASLASGSDKIYLGNAINAQVSTVTKESLPTILADGTFTDDNSQTYGYEQTITVGSRTFDFSNSVNDLDDPALIIDVGTSTTSPLYIMKINFDKAIDFDATESKGQTIEFFGKEYTVGSSSDADELQLFGGSQSIYLDTETDNSATVTVGGVEYTITLKGVTSGGTSSAVIQVETGGTSETKTVNSDASKTINGLSVYVDTANYYGLENKLGDATILVGADEIWLQDGQPVMLGSSKTDIDGTLVDFDHDPGSGNTTYIYINVTAADSDVDHLLAGEAFTDPVFGTFKVYFADAPNAPTLSASKGADENSDRNKIEFMRASDDCVKVKMKVKGNEGTVEFANGANLADDDGHTIHVVEGETMQEDEYFILNSGSYQHFMQIKKINCDDDNNADDDVTLYDVFSEKTYKITDKDLDASTAYDWVILGQTYKLYCTASNTIRMVSSDWATDGTGYISVYPILKPVSGKEFKVAFTDQVTTMNVDVGTQFVLPDAIYNLTSNSTLPAVSSGTVDYNYTVTAVDSDTANVTFAIDIDQDGSNDNPETNPGLLFIEEKDNSDSDNYNAVIIPTAYSSYADVDYDNIAFTNTNAISKKTFDDSNYYGYIDPFGTYIQVDTSDSNQDWATLSYPTEQMYADVYIASTSATATGTASGVERTGVIKSNVAVVDTDVTSTQKSNYHLILGGGPAVNMLTADVLGLDYPTYGADSGIPENGYMIKLIPDAFGNEGQYALVIAGWEAEQTQDACSKVQADMADVTGLEYYYPAAPTTEETTEEETTEEETTTEE